MTFFFFFSPKKGNNSKSNILGPWTWAGCILQEANTQTDADDGMKARMIYNNRTTSSTSAYAQLGASTTAEVGAQPYRGKYSLRTGKMINQVLQAPVTLQEKRLPRKLESQQRQEDNSLRITESQNF